MSTYDDERSVRTRANLDYREAQDRMAALPAYYRWIGSIVCRHIGGLVLDLGCGSGLFMAHYVTLARQVLAVDVNAELLQKISVRFPEAAIRTLRADLSGEWSFAPDGVADTIIALDILEHFEDDVGFARKMARKLRPGGKAIVKVPAQRRLYGEADRRSGHFRRYDRDDLLAGMREAGLAPILCRYWNPVGGWIYRRRRNEPTNFSRSFSRRHLAVINVLIPALRVLDVVPCLQGLSLIGVCRKPG